MSKTALKITITCVIILLVLSVVGYFIFGLTNSNNIKLKDLILHKDRLSLEIGEKINLNELYSIYPNNANANVMCLVVNTSYANISNNKILTAKSCGDTKVLLKVSDGTTFIEKDIDVSITEKATLPDNFYFEKEVININLDNNSTYNPIICYSEYNTLPVITYSNENICSYNYVNGLITPINEGETIVTATFSNKESTITKSFKVTIIDNKSYLITNLEKDGEYYILNTTQSSINNIEVFNSDGSSSNIDVNAIILENGNDTQIIQTEFNNVLLFTSNYGESIIKISLKDDNNVYVLIKIIVKE